MTTISKYSMGTLDDSAGKCLAAVEEAGRVYRHIAQEKGPGTFMTEVSFDEFPQRPPSSPGLWCPSMADSPPSAASRH